MTTRKIYGTKYVVRKPVLILKVSVIFLATTCATIFFLQRPPILIGSSKWDTPSLVSFPAKGQDDQRLNILVLYADDWRHDSVGAAGKQPVLTPFLDSLAAEGIRFTENAVTSAVCWISRATYHSGQYLGRHQSPHLAEPVWYRNFYHSFPAVLRRAGYHVGHVGKWQHRDHELVTADTYNFISVYEGTHWFEYQDGRRVHITKRNQHDAIHFLRDRPRHIPFLLTVAFFAPHAIDDEEEQYYPQPSSMALYQNITFFPPPDVEEAWARMPEFFTEENLGRVRWYFRYDEPTKYDRMMKNYFRLISEVDAACSKIVGELERQGLLDQTLIVFTTDNGLFHSEHGLSDKWYPHAESIRVPLIIRDPRMPAAKKGTVEDALTLNVDLAPTFLAAANASIPRIMQGSDIAQLYMDPEAKATWRTDFFYEHPMLEHAYFVPGSTAVVSREWKYVTWPDHGAEQLFHLITDPQEENDLASDPAYHDILNKLRQRHEELQKASL